MVSGNLKRRGQALEEAFFPNSAEARRERLRLREQEESAREALAAASGISDANVLGQLAALGIRADTLAALTLIPLIEVAWADGRMDPEEREAVLSGAESTGIGRDSPSHRLLGIWLEDPPAPDLNQVWLDFIKALCTELNDEERARLAQNILGRARRVAESAGDLRGGGPGVSEEEAAVLTKLEQAFG